MAKYTVSGHAGYIYDSLLLAGYPVGRIKAKSESGANIVQTLNKYGRYKGMETPRTYPNPKPKIFSTRFYERKIVCEQRSIT